MPPAWPRGLDFHRTLVLLAEGAALASVVTYLGLDWAPLLAEPILFILVLVGLVGAVLVRVRRDPASILTGAILVALFPLAGMATFMRFHLLEPLSGRNFAGASLALLSIVVALPAGIRGRRLARRGQHTSGPRGWRTPHGLLVVGVTSLVAGAIYAAGVASIEAHASGAGAPDFTASEVGADSATLEMVDFRFAPSPLPLRAGRLTLLNLTNRDSELHTFTYVKDGTEYNHNVPPNSNSSAWVFFLEAGTIKFRCVPHSDGYDDAADMVGRLEVRPA
jgi:plastocyanin